MKNSIGMGILLGCSLVSFNAVAITAEEKGLEIAQEVATRDAGWQDSSLTLSMVLRNRQGDESTRKMRMKVMEVPDDGDKSLIFFENPKDVKGTTLLSYSHILKSDDQWLYLPALKRIKRIASSNKSGPFMGSQFAYEDLASFEVDKYQYKYLHEDTLQDIGTFVVENKPTYKYSGYTKQIVWIDKSRFIPLKVEYYDRKNEVLKTLEFSEYKQYLNKYWRAQKQTMLNHQNGKLTTLTLKDYQFGLGLGDRDFHKSNLKRLR